MRLCGLCCGSKCLAAEVKPAEKIALTLPHEMFAVIAYFRNIRDDKSLMRPILVVANLLRRAVWERFMP